MELVIWGTVTEHTQNVLKWQASRNILYTTFAHFAGQRAPTTLNYDEEKTLDKNHSHFLLLDNGRVNCYIDDRPRSDFVKSACAEFKCQAITIIVEGGFNTLEVIKHDLMAKRPVIIIHGSGRLANVLGTLLENSSKETIPEEKDVKEQLESVFHEHWSKLEQDKEKDENSIIEAIRDLFKPEYRKYLSVFYLERDPSLTDIIFKAVDTAHADAEQQKKFLKLAISWNYADRAESMPKRLEDDPKLYPSLFEQALKENRPVFVDYFLRRNHNPLQTTEFLKYSESMYYEFLSKVAIASRIIQFINTDCFNQVLNRQWFGHLPGNATESSIAKLKFLLSLISLGLIKHRLRKYSAEDVVDQTSQEIVSIDKLYDT
ncbi:unnamed protein product [Rotaria sordida]|uniref:TRPM SLOG domain-containing protein n=1 Tax=Rotaria sordida TaxID=392033 RepID=A0A815JHV0_9BILA|nr:unnamed protein product [Rotaria sordida]